MITVKELFDDLSYGELANLKIGNATLSSIAEADFPKLISHINLGLVDLFGKFMLKKKEVRLHQIADVTTYYIRTDYMDEVVYCGKNGIYIEQEAIEPFADDIVKILEVYDAEGGEIPMNRKRDTELRASQGLEVTPGVFTTAHDTLKITLPPVPEIISIIYQALYPKLVVGELFDPAKVKMFIPDFLRKPLMLYIAARIYTSMRDSLTEGEQDIRATRWAAYSLACKEIEINNLVIDEDDTDDHFENSNMP